MSGCSEEMISGIDNGGGILRLNRSEEADGVRKIKRKRKRC